MSFFNIAFAQTSYISKNNYTGNWESSSSWEPVWNTPQTSNINFSITVNGYITCNGNLSFTGDASILSVNDTLVIYGDLTMGNNSDIKVNENGVLIIRGNLNTSDKTNISTNSYIVITGNYTKNGSVNQGSFISYTSPVNLFIGGSIQPGLNAVLFPVFDCPGTAPYANSHCSYGNLIDLLGDPINSFFQSTCTIAKPTITPSGPTTFCEGGSVTLTASAGSTYLWSTGAASENINVTTTGSYTVQVSNSNGCLSALSDAAFITVNAIPAATISIIDNSGIAENDGIICQGESATLVASGGVTYSWASGETTAEITKNLSGTFTVTITDTNGCQNTDSKTLITTSATTNAGIDDEVCGQEYTLNATSNGDAGKWTISSGEGNVTFSPNENDPSAIVEINNYGNYQFTWTAVKENCPVSDDVKIIFHEIPTANAGIDQELNSVFATKMKAELAPLQSGEWSIISGSGIFENFHSPVSAVSGLTIGENTLLWTVISGNCSDTDTVIIKIDDLFVPQVITPNGDQKNDFFVIKDIEKNGPAELIILNRWGNEIYSNTNYLNDWGGRNKNGTLLSNDTYFYFLKFADGKTTKGFVVIKR